MTTPTVPPRPIPSRRQASPEPHQMALAAGDGEGGYHHRRHHGAVYREGKIVTQPICQEDRLDINEREWSDPCGKPATTTYGGRPVCEGHRENAEQRERETIAETFCEGVDIETLRRIAGLGGLKATLASHERLVEACTVALPQLARMPSEAFQAVVVARREALPFLTQEQV